MIATTQTLGRPKQHEFRTQWWRSVLPAVFFVAVLGMLIFRNGLTIAVPGLGLLLLISAANCRGLVISQEGIGWYILRRRWLYRTIPWQKVRDVRKTFFGLLDPIRLIVDQDHYEPWVWGAVRANRQLVIPIHTSGYEGGEKLWDTIFRYWSPRENNADVEAIEDRSAESAASADPAGE